MTTYHVTPAGDDANPGASDLAPLRTLQKALDLAAPGDTVRVAAGEYAGAVKYGPELVPAENKPLTLTGGPGVLIRSGNDRAHGLTFEGFNGLIVTGFDVADLEAKTNGSGLWLADCKNVVVEDFRATNCHEWGCNTSHVRGLTFRRCWFGQARVQHGLYLGNSTRDVLVEDCDFIANANCGIQMNGGQGFTSGRGMPTTGKIEDVTIRNSRFAHNCRRGGADLNLDCVHGATIDGCTVYPGSGKGNCLTLFASPENVGGITRDVRLARNTVVAGAERYAVLIAGNCEDIALEENDLIHSEPDGVLIEVSPPFDALTRWSWRDNHVRGAVFFDAVKKDYEAVMGRTDNVFGAPARPLTVPADPGPGMAPIPDGIDVLPPPSVPAFPETAPAADAADPNAVDVAHGPGNVRVREWDRADIWGDDFAYEGEAPFPAAEFYATPLKGYPYPNHGITWSGYVQAPISGVMQIHTQLAGRGFITFADEVLIDGEAIHHDRLSDVRAFTVEAGKFYQIEVGVLGMPGTVTVASIGVRYAAGVPFKALPTIRSYRPKAAVPVPVPDGQPGDLISETTTRTEEAVIVETTTRIYRKKVSP